MGANYSTTSIDVINNTIINVILSNAQTCSQDATVTQSINRSGFSIFSSTQQIVNFSATCLQTVKVDTNLLQSIANSIIQTASQNSIALLPSFSGSDASVNLQNYLSTSITDNFIQNCATTLKSYQQATYGGLQLGTTDIQSVKLVTECMSSALNNNGVSQGIVSNTNQTTTQTSSNPLDFLTNIFSSSMLIIFGFIFAIIFLLVEVF